LKNPKIKLDYACNDTESNAYDFLFEEVDKIILDGLNKDNVDTSVQLIEALKSREKMIRTKRQTLETLIYNNIHLLVKKANQV
jgi:hypothetical protein